MITENESVRLIFGLKVRNLRQQRNLSYQQLSDATKITVSYLHDIENGKKYPKTDKILALAKVLGTDYDYLVSLTGDKKLQPLIDLLSTDFINVIPWDHFGIAPASLLELFTNTPDKVTAFISTLVKISRAYHLSRENFYTTTLRSYQDIHDNYFEDLEAAAARFREEADINEKLPVSVEVLEQMLKEKHNIHTDRKKLGSIPTLNTIRSYFSTAKQTLYINKQFSSGQEAFLLARELGFQFLGITLRPYETIVQRPSSFDLLLNNFRASYFAAALLIPEEHVVEDIQRISANDRWDPAAWLHLLDKYNVSAEMLLQRLTNILPHHFGIGQLFFLRMSGDEKSGYEIDKELHLSQLHNPHANLVNEHYCRRWLAIRMMQEVQRLPEKKKHKGFIIDAQISHYWQTHNRYLCITLAKPRSRNSTETVSVTLGLLLDSSLMRLMRFVNDESIITRTVHTTCERCSIQGCKERAMHATYVEKKQQEQEIRTALDAL
ncbi:MAG TPA: XRE family transcriptional regulator [Chitinophaga sp.]|uniref:XRE family transcriptional regulator n=1 Tax=Chitinophaga sp. TaxID=1869181 RepID=UPI002C5C3694|nr:XRE family transcriptional regulator [Chitinophaga sp.]HVI46380.1 XRE family transcriptional regulator [Chitinophaga sp.]